MKNKKETVPGEKEREDFWLEIGPPGAYYGTDAEETARQNGDASPDGKHLSFDGAQPENTKKDTAFSGAENLPQEPWDDVPPMDRP